MPKDVELDAKYLLQVTDSAVDPKEILIAEIVMLMSRDSSQCQIVSHLATNARCGPDKPGNLRKSKYEQPGAQALVGAARTSLEVRKDP